MKPHMPNPAVRQDGAPDLSFNHDAHYRTAEVHDPLARMMLFASPLLLLLLTGCASPRSGFNSGSGFEYNPVTGYPAVGVHPWHL